VKHEPVKFALQHPVHDKTGGEVSEITVRPPTGRDILQCGYPYARSRNPRNNEETETVDAPAALALVAACANLPASAVDKMAAVDIFEAIEVLRYFFRMRILAAPSANSPPENGAETAASPLA
jgi:hypothetical protein